MTALEILLAEIEHTAALAIEDGSKVTQSKLNAHLRQYGEAVSREHHAMPQAWRVESVKSVPLKENASGGYETVLTPLYYGPDEDGPKVGATLDLRESSDE